jgi:thioredoxin reductase (NADPH)
MTKPAILAVDDEPTVLSAIARDLRHEYGESYRILRAPSGPKALETIRRLRLRNEPLALLVVDQRMPGMTGIDLIREAIQVVPDVKRVLLTAYADTEAAIRAVNEVRLDHYLMKPWDPPEERLYPVLADLLDEWRAAFAPPFEGIRVVGSRWSARSHEVKDFLVRNLLTYRWLDVEESEAHRRLLDLVGADATQLPVVLFPDGTSLVQPTNQELAQKVGLQTRAGSPVYDLVVVGGGPAGLAAAVYGASEGMRTLVIEREAPGGQAGMSARIENYLGFPVGLSGADLARRAVAQARRFGAEILTPVEATGIRSQGDYRFITLADGSELSTHSILIATGVTYRRLEVPDADRFTGVGVYYGAAITEALACRDKDVYVVGGANAAGQAALYLSQYARSVTLLVRGSSLEATMSQYLVALIEAAENIEIRLQSRVVGLHGGAALEEICVADDAAGTEERRPCPALFVFIGQIPHTDWVGPSIQRDPQGFILSGPDCSLNGLTSGRSQPKRPRYFLETSMPGVFVAGDVRHESMKRIASAVGEGAMAVRMVQQHMASL